MNNSQHDYIGSVNIGRDLSTEIHMFKIDHLMEVTKVFLSGLSPVFVLDSKVKLYHSYKIPKDDSVSILPVYINEKSKSLDKVYELYSYFYHNTNSSASVVGVGGGSLLDLVGFSVKTISGDTPLLFIPTTLSSMLAPFISGKFLVNFDRKKDFLSVRGSPSITVLDPNFIKTQDAYSLNQDCLVALSTGLTCEASFYHFVENSISLGITNWSDDLLKEFLIQNLWLRIGYGKNIFVGEKMAEIIQTASNLMIKYSKALGLGIIIELSIASNYGFLERSVYRKIKHFVTSILKLDKLPIDIQSLYQVLNYDESTFNYSTLKIPILVKPGQIVEIPISIDSIIETVKHLFFEGLGS
ncbi:MAG: 3-dehydroquinate synthase [Thermotogaceae bacterium]|nr:3-dehydroquinate synthase [Thermotogaceae bacterium]